MLIVRNFTVITRYKHYLPLFINVLCNVITLFCKATLKRRNASPIHMARMTLFHLLLRGAQYITILNKERSLSFSQIDREKIAGIGCIGSTMAHLVLWLSLIVRPHDSNQA
jgi:hypothetical protein